jgi:hypothetical protein
MMMSAVHLEQVGPIMLAGSPLSYWAGVHGKRLASSWRASTPGAMIGDPIYINGGYHILG